MPNYVKFLRGTQAAYNALATTGYDDNTLYFVIETDETVGKMYLGDTLVAGSITNDGESIIDTLAELKDVAIADSITNGYVLTFNTAIQKWEPTDVNTLITKTEDTNTTYTLTGVTNENGTILTFTPSDGEANTIEIPYQSLTNYLTKEEVSAAISTAVADLASDEDLAGVKSELQTVISVKADTTVVNEALALKADSSAVYTIAEADAAIAKAVADSAHLKRVIVESVYVIDTTAADADEYIYMVATGLQSDSNKYKEYMVIDGVIEQVGNWEVDLSDYVTKTELTTGLAEKVDKQEGYTLLSPTDQAKLDALVIGDSGGVEISGKVNASNVEELDAWITDHRDSVAGLYPVTDSTKLEGVEEGAQANKIETVSEEFTLENKHLSIADNGIPIAKVANLQSVLNEKATISSLTAVDGRVSILENMLNDTNIDGQLVLGLNSKVTNLNTQVTNQENRIATIESAIAWETIQ